MTESIIIALAVVVSVYIISVTGIHVTITHKTDEAKTLKAPVENIQTELDDKYEKEPEPSFDDVLKEVQRLLDVETEGDN